MTASSSSWTVNALGKTPNSRKLFNGRGFVLQVFLGCLLGQPGCFCRWNDRRDGIKPNSTINKPKHFFLYLQVCNVQNSTKTSYLWSTSHQVVLKALTVPLRWSNFTHGVFKRAVLPEQRELQRVSTSCGWDSSSFCLTPRCSSSWVAVRSFSSSAGAHISNEPTVVLKDQSCLRTMLRCCLLHGIQWEARVPIVPSVFLVLLADEDLFSVSSKFGIYLCPPAWVCLGPINLRLDFFIHLPLHPGPTSHSPTPTCGPYLPYSPSWNLDLWTLMSRPETTTTWVRPEFLQSLPEDSVQIKSPSSFCIHR